jgi:HEAT repeat protein
VRAAAATALGHVPPDTATLHLRQALRDEDSWVRYFAARSLGRHGEAASLDVLASVARNDRTTYVRIAAIEAMAQIGGRRAAELIAPFTKGENIDIVRAATAAYRVAGRADESDD